MAVDNCWRWLHEIDNGMFAVDSVAFDVAVVVAAAAAGVVLDVNMGHFCRIVDYLPRYQLDDLQDCIAIH